MIRDKSCNRHVNQEVGRLSLPFSDGAFDVVVCQFGVMFFPGKAVAISAARRVLRTGETFIFNVWDAIEQNEFADVVTKALAEVFPSLICNSGDLRLIYLPRYIAHSLWPSRSRT